MSRQILCGPVGSGKTRAVVDEYVATVAEQGEDAALLVLPTRLACERLRMQLAVDDRIRGLLDPRIVTFPDFAQRILDANHANVTRINELQQRLLMRQVAEDLCAEGELKALAPMCDFPGFIDVLREDVGEIKRTAMRPEQFARIVEESDGTARSREFARIYAEYQQRLVERELFDDAGRFWQARDVLRDGRRRPFEDLRLILVDGFDDFTTTQLQVLEALADGDGVERLVITLCLEEDQKRRPELFKRPRRTLERIRDELGDIPLRWMDAGRSDGSLARMGERLFAESSEPGLAEGSEAVEVVEAGGQRMEVRQVLARVKRLLQDGVSARQIAIIARDPGGYRRALAEISSELGVPLNLQASEPVGSRPSVQAILDVVRVPAGDLRADDVMRLLKSNYLDRSVAGDAPPEPDEVERICAEANIVGGRVGEDGTAVQHWRERLGRYRRRLREQQDLQAGGNGDDERRWFRGSDDELEDELELVEQIEAALTRVFDRFEPLHDAVTLPEFVEVLAQVMSEFGTLGGLTRSEPGADEPISHQAAANLAAVHAFLPALRELHDVEQTLGIAPRMTLTEFRDELLRVAQSVSFVPPGASAGVTVIDAGQARQLAFDHVFVLGMTERQFPRVPTEDALFGDDRRRELARAGVPLDQRSESVHEDAFLFYSIAVAAREHLTLSYPGSDAEGQEALRSYFVEEVERCFAGPVPKAEYGLADHVPAPGDAASPRELLEATLFGAFGYDVLLWPAHRDEAVAALQAWGGAFDALPHLREMIELQDRRSDWRPLDAYDGMLGPEAAATVTQRFGPQHTFSASALRQFGGCPFTFFGERVLGLKEIDEPSEDVDRALTGSIVHRCLSNFFDRWREHREDLRIEDDDREEAREVLDEVISAVFEEEQRLGTAGDEALFAIEREKTRENLHAWLDYEIDEIQAEGHTAWLMEQSFGYGRTESVQIGAGDQQVLVGGRIDRIDRLDDIDGAPAFAVYDYKTGSIPYKSRMEDGGDFQLPVYALAGRQIADDPNAVCADWGYYSVRRPIALKNRPRKSDPVGDIEGYIASASEWAMEYARQIRAGQFAPESPGGCPGWCPFRGICRWDEFRFARKQGGEQSDE